MASPLPVDRRRLPEGTLVATILLTALLYALDSGWYWVALTLGLLVAVPGVLLWRDVDDPWTTLPTVAAMGALAAGVIALALGRAFLVTWFVAVLLFVPLAHHVARRRGSTA